MPKFDKTYCSQCGEEFGPGDTGFSHCDQHKVACPACTSVSGSPRFIECGYCDDGLVSEQKARDWPSNR